MGVQEPLPALTRQLFEVSSLTTTRMRRVLADAGLTESTAGLLWALDADRPALSMRELARTIGCDPSNITLIGDRLQRAGLVVRLPHPTDRRARLLVLTETGRAARTDLMDRLAAATPLPTLTAREQQALGRLLVKLGATP